MPTRFISLTRIGAQAAQSPVRQFLAAIPDRRLDVVAHEHVANAELVIHLHHGEVVRDGIGTLKMKRDGEFVLPSGSRDVICRFDEDVRIGPPQEVVPFLGNGPDRRREIHPVPADRERNHIETVLRHAPQHGYFQLRIAVVRIWQRHVPNERVGLKLPGLIRYLHGCGASAD